MIYLILVGGHSFENDFGGDLGLCNYTALTVDRSLVFK